MKDDRTGGPAFPNKDELGNMVQGMTLRDWFAGQALNQMLRWEFAEGQEYEDLAKQAYMASDAMLAAREKGTK